VRTATALALGVLLVAAAVVGGRAAAGTAAASCTPGVITYGGAQARVFCGPAKATLKYQGKTWKFTQGSCDKLADYVSVNIGTVVIGTSTKKKPDYFGLTVGKFLGAANGAKPARHDGTYTGGVVASEHGGKGGPIVNAELVKITLSGNRSRGTFSGPVSLGTGKVTGSFTC